MKPALFSRALVFPALCLGMLPLAAHAQTTVITSCVSKLTGVSRIVTSAANCNASTETVTYWNQQGPQGPAGLQGFQGPQGSQGAAGTTGAQGAAGVAGPQGQKGDAGAAGAQGLQGAAGAKGDTGAQGSQGPQGAAGASGPQGPQGDSGAVGAAGPKGDAGPAGPQGAVGAAGAAGPKGDTGSAGMQGVAGAKGDQGAQGIQGAKGDIGVQGAKGDAGAQGIQGAKGNTGAQGNQGAKGDVGAQGAKGDPGTQGQQGVAGTQGPQGSQGAAGANGAGYSATSNTPQQVFPGTHTFIVQTGLAYVAGSYIRAIATGTQFYLEGTVSSYSGAVLTMNATGGNYPPFVTQTFAASWAFSIAGVTGATGAAGATGPAGQSGPTGPAGPSGPTGKSGASYDFLTISYHVILPGSFYGNQMVSCPSGGKAVSGSCGYASSDTIRTEDANDIVLSYTGLDLDRTDSAFCRLNNLNKTQDRGIVIAVTCAVPSATASNSSTAMVLKTCTYDPDTQQPCTVADAVIHNPLLQKAQMAQTLSASQAAGAANPSLISDDTANGTNKGKKKVHKSITLSFLVPQ